MEEDYDRIIQVIDQCNAKNTSNKHNSATSSFDDKLSKKNLLNVLAADDYHYCSTKSCTSVTTSLDHKTKSKMRKARGLHFRVKIGGDTLLKQQDKDHFNEARLSKV